MNDLKGLDIKILDEIIVSGLNNVYTAASLLIGDEENILYRDFWYKGWD